MYWKQLGFQRAPFSGSSDPARFFESTSQQEGLARLEFLVQEHRRGAIVTGVPGAGKTALVGEFTRRIGHGDREIVVVDCPAFGARELFFDMAQEMGLNPPRESSEADLWRMLRQAIRAHRAHGGQTIFIIDQAELLLGGAEGVHALNALFHLDTDPAANHAIIVVSRPEAVAKCRRELVECMDLSVIVEPFTEGETKRYVDHVASWAGATGCVFDEEALEAIHELSGGVPRWIDRACDLALVAAAAAQKDHVDERAVRSIADELRSPVLERTVSHRS